MRPAAISIATPGTTAGAPPDPALLALQLGDREVDRLGYGEVESAEQPERSQQLDHRGHLDRLAPLRTLHGRLTDPRLGGQLGLRPIALDPVTRQPPAELGEHSGICHKLM
jgi:hypothetical protein